MELVLRNIQLPDPSLDQPMDVMISDGLISAIQPDISTSAQEIDMAGRIALPGFVDSHIHLDKACILDRCHLKEGTLEEAISQVSNAKQDFTVDDIRARAVKTLEKCILQGTTRIRAHLEVDPKIGLKSIEAVLPLIREYAWAIDLEICVFPQEGMLNNPGTEELMIEALRMGAKVLGGCPYTDSDPRGQIQRVFEIAREFDVDIDFHLDFDTDPANMTVGDVCEFAEKFDYGGRVAIGHVSKLSALKAAELARISNRMADTGVAVTVLPSTDLFLMGGARDHNILRGVAPVHRLLEHGVNCSLATNNVLNPFTPFGDCSMIRMANLYANIAQIGTQEGMEECLAMVTQRPADILRLKDYGIAVGNRADIVILDSPSGASAVQEIAPPLYGFKRGRQTFSRKPAVLHRP